MKSIFMLTLVSIGLVSAAVFTHATGPVQTYNDVVVIINSNSPVSEEIGTYFAAQRNIPAENIIRISVPVTEEITDTQFADLRTKLEGVLTSRGLASRINYLVTTKGMPLKINRTDPNANASVESELTLILGKYAANIGKFSRIRSPYFGIHGDFSHAAYDIFLVTRLDGYTSADIHGLIDRAAAIPSEIQSDAKFVLDQDPAWDTTTPQLNANLVNASALLMQKHLTVVLNTTPTYLTHQTGVIGYMGWGCHDHQAAAMTDHGKQDNTYLPGAIGETYVPTSGRSFTQPMVYGQSAIADMIAEGITGVKGYVYEPYAGAMSDARELFSMYADGYTLAESFYSASPYLSWMDVVVGDPKCRIVNTRASSSSLKAAAALPKTLVSSLTNYPNPFNPTTTISFTLEQSGQAILKVYNVIGQEVATLFNGEIQAGVRQSVTFDAQKFASGCYFSVLESNGKRITQRMLLSK
ncbi:MAG TPA: TIGR03790 family protein [Bacteroidota bacterium]|nr:TIGR03790 family protein [Bacteroidota bacterium]